MSMIFMEPFPGVVARLEALLPLARSALATKRGQ